jgi:Emfourin
MIHFKREGGFAGLSTSKEVDETDMPENIRKLLKKLPEVKPKTGKSLRRDGFKYTIEVEEDEKETKYIINEEDVPEAIAPLIEYLDGL